MADSEESLASTSAPATMFRLGHGPDPWDWPDWAYAKPDGTFGNRWDDPDGLYRVLYAATERLGTFIETLARFRPDAEIIARLKEIEDEAGGEDDALLPGHVPKSWLENRRVGQASIEGEFADVGHSLSVGWLHAKMAARLVHYGIKELDAGTIRLSSPRRLTQEISRKVYELTTAGHRRFAGIAYGSRLGDDIHNWAIFEPGEIHTTRAENLTANDTDLLIAVERLGLTLVDG